MEKIKVCVLEQGGGLHSQQDIQQVQTLAHIATLQFTGSLYTVPRYLGSTRNIHRYLIFLASIKSIQQVSRVIGQNRRKSNVRIQNKYPKYQNPK